MNRHPIVQEDLEMILSDDLPREAFSGATILITGVNGFLPAYLVETLLCLNEKQSGNLLKVLDQPGYIRSQVQRTCPDTTKSRHLGWEPTVSVPDGFRRTILSFL